MKKIIIKIKKKQEIEQDDDLYYTFISMIVVFAIIFGASIFLAFLLV